MYHEHFGFFTSPFSLSPHLQFLYRSSAFEETMAHLVYGLEGGEDIILITGEIGTGKTLALYNLAQHITKTYRTALINVTQLDFRELLKMLLVELDVEVPSSADRADLLTALKTELMATMRRGQRLLLIIDEAQNLDDATLEGVRLLTNLGPPEEQALQVVLAGQPGLRANVNKPELAQIRQRIRVHYHLDKLGPQETRDYIEHRVKVAGCEKSVFRQDAIEHIHRLSDGIPRLVNMVADRALLAAYVDGADQVRTEHVDDDSTLPRSPVEESVVAAVAAQASESPPLVKPEPPELSGDTAAESESEPTPEPEPVPEPEPTPEPEPEEVIEPEPEPESVDEALDDITASALADDTPDAVEESGDEPETGVAESAGVAADMLDDDLLDDDLDVTVVPETDDSEAESDDDASPPMAVPRRGGGARRLLAIALVVVGASVVTMVVLAHQRGLITLPFLPAAQVTETTAPDDSESSDLLSSDDAGLAAIDSLGGSVTETADSLMVETGPDVSADPVISSDPVVSSDPSDDGETAPADPLPIDTTPDGGTDTPDVTVDETVVDTTPAQSSQTLSLPVPPPGLYVHLGSFRDLARADVFAGRCAGLDLLPFIVEAVINDKTWYRVHVGPFAELDDAQLAQITAQDEGLTSWSMIVRLP